MDQLLKELNSFSPARMYMAGLYANEHFIIVSTVIIVLFWAILSSALAYFISPITVLIIISLAGFVSNALGSGQFEMYIVLIISTIIGALVLKRPYLLFIPGTVTGLFFSLMLGTYFDKPNILKASIEAVNEQHNRG
jgi:hypothetical protein